MLVLLTALALSADGFAAGAAFGMRGVKIGAAAKGAIALLSTAFAAAAILLGGALGTFLPAWAGRAAAALILIAIGLDCCIRALLPPKPQRPPRPPVRRRFRALGLTILVIREPAAGDLDGSGAIDIGEALLLGFSLSVDMLGAGVGLALAGAGSVWLPPVVGIVQTICLTLGALAGRMLARLPVSNRALACASGLLLAGLGAARLLL